MDIAHLVARRSDLSTFVVHLTRDSDGQTGKDRLISIVQSSRIKACSVFGQAKSKLKERGEEPDSQKCVCFTETPLEYLFLLCEEIEGREIQFRPYGVAVTKKVARLMGVNPVWYLDMSPGKHQWLTKAVDQLIAEALAKEEFSDSPVAQIAPFLEQMGTGRSEGGTRYRKEFWWEREWRKRGSFLLPRHVILLCPEVDHPELEAHAKKADQSATLIDPKWGLEQIIARLAGFTKEEIEIL